VPPGEELVQIPDFTIKLVIFFRPDYDNGMNVIIGYPAADIENSFIGDFLGITNTMVEQFFGAIAVCQNTGNDQRSEKISFTGFIDSEDFIVGQCINWRARYILRSGCRF